jgi:hypothetical protein
MVGEDGPFRRLARAVEVGGDDQILEPVTVDVTGGVERVPQHSRCLV